jgi:membrane-associated phospholipid phosphatase
MKPALRVKAFIFYVGVLLTLDARAQNWDIDLLKQINPTNPSSNYWSQTSNSLYWVPAAVSFGTLATGLIKKDKKLQQNGYELLISNCSAILVSEIMKSAFQRQRPSEKYPNEVFSVAGRPGRSFPSGHTIGAFATATTISLQYKKWYVTVPAFLWACSVGYSRMYLGRHYPSDVLAGAALGIGGGYLSHWVTKKIFRRQKKL